MTTPPDQPETRMDLDAWLDDVELVTTTVTVFAKSSLVNRHNDLNTQLRDALQKQREAGSEGQSEATLGDEAEGNDVARLTEQVDANYQAMKASGHTFTFSALTQEIYDDLLKAHTDLSAPPEKRFDGAGFMMASMAASAVPRMSVAEVATLRRRLPVSEFGRLATAVQKVINGSVDLPL